MKFKCVSNSVNVLYCLSPCHSSNLLNRLTRNAVYLNKFVIPSNYSEIFKQFYSASQRLECVSVDPILFSWTGGFKFVMILCAHEKHEKNRLVLSVFNIVIYETNFESVFVEIYLPIVEIFLGYYKKSH